MSAEPLPDPIPIADSQEPIANGEPAAPTPEASTEQAAEKKVNDELWRIELALTKAGGDRGKAAAMLKMSRRRLNQKILHTATLRERWMFKKDGMISPAVTIDREQIQFRPRGTFRKVATDAEIEAAVKREDAKFKQGLSGLKLKAEELDWAVALQSYQKRHFRESADLIGGSITRGTIKTSMLMEEMADRLQKPFSGDKALEEEQMCWQAYFGLSGELRRNFHVVNDAGLKKKILELEQEKVKQGTGRGRPGFGPLQKTEVHVHTEKNVGQLKMLRSADIENS